MADTKKADTRPGPLTPNPKLEKATGAKCTPVKGTVGPTKRG
jgi:hypothetical protein